MLDTVGECREWIEKAEKYLRHITGRTNSKSHLIDEIICTEVLVTNLRLQNKALKQMLLGNTSKLRLTDLEKALLAD